MTSRISFIAFLSTLCVYAEAFQDSVRTNGSLELMAIGCLVETATITTHGHIPYLGVGNFIQGKWQHGLFYLGGETGLLYLDNTFEKKIGDANYAKYPNIYTPNEYRRTYGLSPDHFAYLRYKDLINQSLFYIRLFDFYESYKGFHQQTALLNKVTLPDESIPNLMLSPFKVKYLSNPWVYVPIILAGGVTYFGTQSDQSLSSAQNITLYNSSFSSTAGGITYGGILSYRYLIVAAGEEMFFRGALQTELIERTNFTTALIASSVLFGAWHIPNNGIGGGLAATVAGLYLGNRYQNSGYDLGEVIAIHFWLDFLPSVIEFCKDPKSSQIVYRINWQL